MMENPTPEMERAQESRIRMHAEISRLRSEVYRLKGIIKDAGLWKEAPCCICGYNGPGYFQPKTHFCAGENSSKRPSQEQP